MEAVLERMSVVDQGPLALPGVPDWFSASREAGWKRFQELPMPSRQNEEWRFASLRPLEFSKVKLAPEKASASVAVKVGLEERAARFVFVNDALSVREGSLPKGVVCLPLEDALVTHSDLVEQYFMKSETRLGSEKFAALHRAHVTNGLFVHVPDGVQIDKPIEVFHRLAGDHIAVFPHTLVVTGRDAKVTVVDYFQSEDVASSSWVLAVNDLVAGEGSSLTYVAIQDLNEVSRMLQVNETTVAANARAKAFSLNVGAEWVRQESLSRLDGEGAHSDMLSVNIAARDQRYDQRTFQDHASPHTYSDLLYKNSLYDVSKTVFSGLIQVDEGAHYTDAYQTCRNLLMSDDAEATSMPGLEINADQVKCSHGSTSSQIHEDEIFYLCTRGICPTSARQLVARGFSVEAIERLKDEPIEELILSFVDAKFAHIKGGGA
jgi:Fe-S cluster assembly protein SufD